MTALTTPELVAIDVTSTDRQAVIRQLASLLAAAGRVSDLDGFVADVLAREVTTATGMPGAVGLPHAKSAHVTVPSLAVGRVPGGVDFGGPDGDATLVFLIAAPAGGAEEHLKILAALARRLMHTSFRDAIRTAPDADAVAAIIAQEVVPA
ncbi:PTS sugar transporter subunit IIA [Xylanimonas allomyrinae]|uniref:PTS sugar transporter subunit IIA n=1 Tax=Xylanimonas allomyrinae TaxID=2509459 RepID=A0A4V0YE13_9MICO|nr:PTS sugar transporter subunit IIA [Xylanimonas allomyrinae]QAY62611.1 PTS sugar transporter subunit IIA [Xylanimonas allomyrinae]